MTTAHSSAATSPAAASARARDRRRAHRHYGMAARDRHARPPGELGPGWIAPDRDRLAVGEDSGSACSPRSASAARAGSHATNACGSCARLWRVTSAPFRGQPLPIAGEPRQRGRHTRTAHAGRATHRGVKHLDLHHMSFRRELTSDASDATVASRCDAAVMTPPSGGAALTSQLDSSASACGRTRSSRTGPGV